MRRKNRQRNKHPIVFDLRRVREEKGLKRKQLAHALGYNINALARWERGEEHPSFQAFNDWCQALGVKPTLELQ